MSDEQKIPQLADHLFRHEAGRMIAVLTRLLGFSNLDAAEDIVQETLLQAMTTWKHHGIPDNPEAWLYTVARRKAIDVVRKAKRIQHHHEALNVMLQSEWTLGKTVDEFFLVNEIEDSQLRMIFACCHPAVAYDSQVAITLRILCGLSVREIASAFLTNEETISKRIYRARETIREKKIELDQPVTDLAARLEPVLQTLYLLFNEGYNSASTDALIRKDLCLEAIRLCALLTHQPATNRSQTHALLALMSLQASRFDSRIDDQGNIIVLRRQDRSKWDQQLIRQGLTFMEHAAQGDHLSAYHIEATIAVCHAIATSFEQTDWKKILALYEMLARLRPGHVVELNSAIARGYAETPQAGIEALLKLTNLDSNYLYHSALADFYAMTGNEKEAYERYRRAEALAPTESEKKFLRSK